MVRVVTLVMILCAARADAAPDPDKLVDALHELGSRTLAGMPSQVTGGDAQWIAAVGPCVRPSPDEIAALTTRAGEHHRGDPSTWKLRFGCKEPTGIIVEADMPTSDPKVPGGRIRVVIHLGAEVSEIHAGVGQRPVNWAWPVMLDAVALVDLDGDGVHDVVIAQAGDDLDGQPANELWLTSSKAERTYPVARRLGTVAPGAIEVAAGQPRTTHPPLILESLDPHAGEPSYRCIEVPDRLTLCPAVEAARRFDAARVIASAWAAADAKTAPDREALADQMLALAPYGITPAERTRLLPLAAPASPAVAIAREVARALDRRSSRRYGELLPPVIDPRPARTLAMLGDAPCAELSRTARTAALGLIRAWVAHHHPHPTYPSFPILLAACEAPGQGYYLVSWRDQAALDLFYSRAGTLRLVAEAAELDARLYRRSASVVALIQAPAQFSIEVDGAVVAPPASGAGEVYRIGHEPVNDLVGAAGQFFHWEGGDTWAPIAVPFDVHPRTPPPRLDPQRDALALWLWQQARFDSALDRLRHFDADAWQRDPDVRADVHQALMILGADPASVKRAAAAEAAVGK